MSYKVPILRIDSDGRIVESNALAREFLGVSNGDLCHTAIRARDRKSRLVCTATCAQDMANSTNGAGDYRTVMVRETFVRLGCHRVGNEVIVFFLPCIGVDSWTENLTPREREVISLVARGETSREISKLLGICTATVRTHVEHIREKLDARTRAEAVAKALATDQID